MRLLTLFTIAVAAIPSVWSHSFLLNPKPRTLYDAPVTAGSIRKYPYDINGRFQSFSTVGWCGTVNPSPLAVPASTLADNLPDSLPANYPPLTTKNTYNAGDQITVYWAHPLPHPDQNTGTVAKPIMNYGVRFAINYTATDMVVLNKATTATTKSPVGQFDGHIEQGWGMDAFQLANLPWLPNATFTLPAGKTCNNCVLQFWIDAASDGGGYIDCADIKIAAQVGGVTTKPPTTTKPIATAAPTTPGTVSGPTTVIVISGPIVPSVISATGGGNNGDGGVATPPPTDGGDGTVVTDNNQIYTLLQVGNHANPTDCWIALDGMVYDVTKLIDVHPGGAVIIDYCGQDSSSIFSNNHRANDAADRALLDSKYKIGTLQMTIQPGANGRSNDATSISSSLVLLLTSFFTPLFLML